MAEIPPQKDENISRISNIPDSKSPAGLSLEQKLKREELIAAADATARAKAEKELDAAFSPEVPVEDAIRVAADKSNKERADKNLDKMIENLQPNPNIAQGFSEGIDSRDSGKSLNEFEANENAAVNKANAAVHTETKAIRDEAWSQATEEQDQAVADEQLRRKNLAYNPNEDIDSAKKAKPSEAGIDIATMGENIAENKTIAKNIVGGMNEANRDAKSGKTKGDIDARAAAQLIEEQTAREKARQEFRGKLQARKLAKEKAAEEARAAAEQAAAVEENEAYTRGLSDEMDIAEKDEEQKSAQGENDALEAARLIEQGEAEEQAAAVEENNAIARDTTAGRVEAAKMDREEASIRREEANAAGKIMEEIAADDAAEKSEVVAEQAETYEKPEDKKGKSSFAGRVINATKRGAAAVAKTYVEQENKRKAKEDAELTDLRTKKAEALAPEQAKLRAEVEAFKKGKEKQPVTEKPKQEEIIEAEVAPEFSDEKKLAFLRDIDSRWEVADAQHKEIRKIEKLIKNGDYKYENKSEEIKLKGKANLEKEKARLEESNKKLSSSIVKQMKALTGTDFGKKAIAETGYNPRKHTEAEQKVYRRHLTNIIDAERKKLRDEIDENSKKENKVVVPEVVQEESAQAEVVNPEPETKIIDAEFSPEKNGSEKDQEIEETKVEPEAEALKTVEDELTLNSLQKQIEDLKKQLELQQVEALQREVENLSKLREKLARQIGGDIDAKAEQGMVNLVGYGKKDEYIRGHAPLEEIRQLVEKEKNLAQGEFDKLPEKERMGKKYKGNVNVYRASIEREAKNMGFSSEQYYALLNKGYKPVKNKGFFSLRFNFRSEKQIITPEGKKVWMREKDLKSLLQGNPAGTEKGLVAEYKTEVESMAQNQLGEQWDSQAKNQTESLIREIATDLDGAIKRVETLFGDVRKGILKKYNEGRKEVTDPKELAKIAKRFGTKTSKKS